MFLHSVLYISVSNGFFPLSYLVIDLHACVFFSPINLNCLVACHTQFSLNGLSFCIASSFFLLLVCIFCFCILCWLGFSSPGSLAILGVLGGAHSCLFCFSFFVFLLDRARVPLISVCFSFYFLLILFLLSIEREIGTGGGRVAGEVSPLQGCVDALLLCWHGFN